MKYKLNPKQIFILAAAAIVAAVISYVVYNNFNQRAMELNVDLYFMNADGTSIVSEPDTFRFRNDSELIKDVFEELRNGPLSSKRGRIMPKDTKLNNIEFQDNKAAVVDLSEEFLTEDSSRNVLAVYAITKSLCSTGRVLSVKVVVNGHEITDRDGNELGFVAASDINLETEEYSSEMREVALYFTDESGKKLVREIRTIKITDQQPIEQYIINELIKGPQSEGLRAVLSKETVLISVDVEDNICYLNFKSDFLKENSGGSEQEKLAIYSIVNSLTELQTIARVQFYMDGKRVDTFGDFNIKNYIARDISIIEQ